MLAARGLARPAAMLAAARYSSRGTVVRCLATAAPPAVGGGGAKLNLSKALDKEHEGKSLSEVLKLPPGALQGLKAGTADELLKPLKIRTISDLARWKPPKAARAIAALAAVEVEGARPAGALSNVNGLVDKAYEHASFAELLAAPPSALQGLAPWVDDALKKLRVKTIKDLAKWKFALWAEAIHTLAAYEREDGGSR